MSASMRPPSDAIVIGVPASSAMNAGRRTKLPAHASAHRAEHLAFFLRVLAHAEDLDQVVDLRCPGAKGRRLRRDKKRQRREAGRAHVTLDDVAFRRPPDAIRSLSMLHRARTIGGTASSAGAAAGVHGRPAPAPPGALGREQPARECPARDRAPRGRPSDSRRRRDRPRRDRRPPDARTPADAAACATSATRRSSRARPRRPADPIARSVSRRPTAIRDVIAPSATAPRSLTSRPRMDPSIWSASAYRPRQNAARARATAASMARLANDRARATATAAPSTCSASSSRARSIHAQPASTAARASDSSCAGPVAVVAGLVEHVVRAPSGTSSFQHGRRQRQRAFAGRQPGVAPRRAPVVCRSIRSPDACRPHFEQPSRRVHAAAKRGELARRGPRVHWAARPAPAPRRILLAPYRRLLGGSRKFAPARRRISVDRRVAPRQPREPGEPSHDPRLADSAPRHHRRQIPRANRRRENVRATVVRARRRPRTGRLHGRQPPECVPAALHRRVQQRAATRPPRRRSGTGCGRAAEPGPTAVSADATATGTETLEARRTRELGEGRLAGTRQAPKSPIARGPASASARQKAPPQRGARDGDAHQPAPEPNRRHTDARCPSSGYPAAWPGSTTAPVARASTASTDGLPGVRPHPAEHRCPPHHGLGLARARRSIRPAAPGLESLRVATSAP